MVCGDYISFTESPLLQIQKFPLQNIYPLPAPRRCWTAVSKTHVMNQQCFMASLLLRQLGCWPQTVPSDELLRTSFHSTTVLPYNIGHPWNVPVTCPDVLYLFSCLV